MKRVTDTKSHKNIKQSQTRKGEIEKQQNPRITPSNQKITNIEKSRTKKEKDERTRSKDYVTDLKRRKYKNIQRKVNKKEAKTEDRITNRIPTVTNTRNPKRNRYDGQKEGKPGTISPLPNYVRRGPTLIREIYPQRDYYSSTTNSRRHMCVYSLERTPNETRLRPKRRCIATLFRRRQRLPAGFVHETAGSSIYRYRERDGSTWSEGGYCRSWKGCQWSMVCRWWTVRCNHVIHTFSHGSSLTHCQSPLPPCTLSAFSF